MVRERTQRIGVEAQCWRVTAFAELNRATPLPLEVHEQLQLAIKMRHRERIARALEAAEESLGELNVLARRLAEAVRFGEYSTVRRLVFEIGRT